MRSAGVLPSLLHSDSMWAFITLIWILATFYGGGFGLMPAFLTAQVCDRLTANVCGAVFIAIT